MVARKKTKCHECNIVDEQEKIIDEDNINKRYHATCLEVARKKKEFLKKEKEQKDELFYKLLKVHGLRNTQEIPPLFYMKVEEIRNDSGLLGKIDKQYKRGVKYNAISATYDFCVKKIEDAIKTVSFDSKLGEMQYCLAIVRNNLVDSYNYAVHMMKQKQRIDVENKNNEDDRIITYKKKESDNDISQFL